MEPDAIITLAVVAIMLLGLVLELLAPDVIVFSAFGFLLLLGIISPQEALVGFSNKGMLTVGILFIVAYAAQSSGVLEFFATRVIGRASGGRRALLKVMVPVFCLSAFLNNTPIVAMFTPTIRDWALRQRLAPSKFLLPLSYASIFGGICTLIGTSTNLVVNGLLQQETGLSIGMYDLAWVGIPCAMAGFIFFILVGYRLLPQRTDLSEDFLSSGREYLLEMRVPDGSPYVGKTVEQAGLRQLEKLFLAELIRTGRAPTMVRPTDKLMAGDRLLFTGTAESIVQLSKEAGLIPVHEQEFCEALRRQGKGRIIEAVVSRSSPMLGKTIKEGNFRSRYDAAVLAVHRHGERLEGKIGKLILKPGDTLLVLAGDDFFKRWNQSRDFYMISKLSSFPEINPRKTILSLATLSGMVLCASLGFLDIFRAAVLAVIVLLLTRCLTAVEARRSIELNVLIIIACSLGISKALDKTGAAGFIAEYLIAAAKDFGPIGLLSVIYLCTSLLTEVITNNAAAALVFPIAMSSALQAGLNPMPFAIAIAVSASASFATPIGYQTNLMVYGAGGYKFSDFLRIGIPMNLTFMVVSLTVIPLVWNF